MIALAANYTRIRISKELTEYRDAVDMEELELHTNMDKASSQQYWHTTRWLDPSSRLTRDRDDESEYSDEAFDEGGR